MQRIFNENAAELHLSALDPYFDEKMPVASVQAPAPTKNQKLDPIFEASSTSETNSEFSNEQRSASPTYANLSSDSEDTALMPLNGGTRFVMDTSIVLGDSNIQKSGVSPRID
jgi:hypothetical protein